MAGLISSQIVADYAPYQDLVCSGFLPVALLFKTRSLVLWDLVSVFFATQASVLRTLIESLCRLSITLPKPFIQV